MNVVDMEVLENLDYENGKALLFELGYGEDEQGCSEDSPMYDLIEDIYYSLYDDNDELVHRVSYSMFMLKNEEYEDPEDEYVLVKEGWEEVEKNED